MRTLPNARWRIAGGLAAVLVALVVVALASRGGSDDAPPPIVTVPEGSGDGATDKGSDADEVTNDPAFERAGRKAERELSVSDDEDAWAVPDAVARPMDRLWDAKRGVYVSPNGRISTRLNAELLRLHAAAAVAGHAGPAREDGRVRRLVRYLTGPAYVDTTEGEKFGGSRHNEIHAPGWRQSSSAIVNQHPSIDATVARGLRGAWQARDKVGLSKDLTRRIVRDVVAVASSKTFRAPARLLNQINWNADLYAAAATVSGDDGLLRDDYREQLSWFAEHAHEPVREGGSPNLSAGDGFLYQPEAAPSAPLNRSDTAEYASTVLGALRYYDQAVRAGMEPLRGDDKDALAAWARHTLDADWTPSGYLNWETGKGASRLHLRQYWALALDGAAGAARGATGLTGRPAGDGDRMLSRSEQLFRRWTAGAGSVLLPATAFNFPSQFVSVRNNRTTASVRFAATVADWASTCDCDGRLAATLRARAPVRGSLDPQFRRLTVNGPRYATAISPTAIPTGGGLEPGWLLDANATSLTALGGGGQGSLGLRMVADGRTLIDTQPGRAKAAGWALRPVTKARLAWSGRLANGPSVVRVTHRFLPDRIVTTYLVDPRRPVEVQLRLPSAGLRGSVGCATGVLGPASRGRLPGCRAGQDYVVRSSGGGSMHVGLLGLTPGGTLTRSRPASRPTLPRAGEQATVRIRITRRTQITRIIRPDAD